MVWLGIGVALTPLVLTILFILFVATPMYSTEARFAIRGGDAGASAAGVTNILSAGSGNNPMSGFVDGYAVRDFLQSRDAMERLDRQVGLAALLARSTLDPFTRVPRDPTVDQLYDAYQSIINVRFNMIEQIVVLNVQAFSPGDAVTIAKALLIITEEFADQLNQRARADAQRVAEREVLQAEKRSADARMAITRWRAENANIDPTTDVAMLTNLIAQVESQLVTAENDLAEIDSTGNRNHPRRRSVALQVQTLKDRVAEIRKRLASSGTGAAGQIASYEALKIAQEFAESNLAQMRQSAEQARLATLRQQKFVAVIADPKIDNRVAYPSKSVLLGGALVIGLALAFFGSVALGLVRTYLMS